MRWVSVKMDVVSRVRSAFPIILLFFFLSILTEQIFVDSAKDHKGGSDPHTNGIIHHFAI